MAAEDGGDRETGAEELDGVLEAAARARGFADQSPATRADQLVAVADALEESAGRLVPVALRETGLPEVRLNGELTRTVVQLRLFSEVVRAGDYLHATIDLADPDFAIGARPDLRRYRTPVGVVLNFAASNFPFAFSVAGGDSAAALAAGCPVILKAHPGHPELSDATTEIVRTALTATGAPDGVFQVIHGVEAGTRALRDERVDAATFTGSQSAGRRLADIAAARPRPIPFYGELGSINPVFVTRAALSTCAEEIVSGFVGSFTLGTGQFCTKPGVLFLPRNHGLEDDLVAHASKVDPARLLYPGILSGYRARKEAIQAITGVTTLLDGREDEQNLTASPTLVTTSLETARTHGDTLLEEAFGPLSLVVEYDAESDLESAAQLFPGSLTASIHAGEPDYGWLPQLTAVLRERAGRILFDGWPTGVAVTPAQQHGGPYPATTAPLHTSVGSAAIDRFLRPVSFQNTPEQLLPEPVRTDNPWNIPQQINQAGQSTRWGRGQ